MGLLFFLARILRPAIVRLQRPRPLSKAEMASHRLPLLIFALAVHVPVVYLLPARAPLATFIGSLYESGWFRIYLHVWFLGHLLLYSWPTRSVGGLSPRQAGPLVLAATQERGNRGAHRSASPDHLGSALVISSRRLVAAVWCAGDRARTSAAIPDLVRAGSGGLPG
jgi:hypothetical protein